MKPISKFLQLFIFFLAYFSLFFFWFLFIVSFNKLQNECKRKENKDFLISKSWQKVAFLGITEIKLLTITNFLLSSFLNCFPSLHGLCLQFYSSTNYYSVKPKKKNYLQFLQICSTKRQWYWSILGFEREEFGGDEPLKTPSVPPGVPPRGVQPVNPNGGSAHFTARLSELYGTNSSGHLWTK